MFGLATGVTLLDQIATATSDSEKRLKFMEEAFILILLSILWASLSIQFGLMFVPQNLVVSNAGCNDNMTYLLYMVTKRE